jgi:hypothetical protein
MAEWREFAVIVEVEVRTFLGQAGRRSVKVATLLLTDTVVPLELEVAR